MKRNLFITLAAMGLIVVLNTACRTDEPDEDTMDARILSLMQSNGIPGLSAGIVRDNALVWSQGYGYADREGGIEATKDTSYMMMSISKTLMAVAVMQLVEEGLLDLDDDVQTYLPFTLRHKDYPDSPITLRLLLSHAASLAGPEGNSVLGQDLYRYFPGDTAPRISEWIPQYLSEEGEHYLPAIWTDARPGTTFLYSNIGTSLVAYIVEQVSQMDYTDYCRDKILTPLEMEHSSFWLADLDITNVAAMYGTHNGGNPVDRYSLMLYAVGGLKSSVAEYAHMLVMMMNDGVYKGQRLLTKASVDQILSIQNPAIYPACLIWFDYDGWFCHYGGEEGGSTTTEFDRPHKVGFIILANRYSTSILDGGDIYNEIKKKARSYRN